MIRKIAWISLVLIVVFFSSVAFATENQVEKLESEVLIEPGWFEITPERVWGFIRSDSILVKVSDYQDEKYVDLYGKPITLAFNGTGKVFLPRGGFFQPPMNEHDYIVSLQEKGLEEKFPLYGNANTEYLLKSHIDNLYGEISVLKYEKIILQQKVDAYSSPNESSATVVEELKAEINRLSEENSSLKAEVSKLEAFCNKLIDFMTSVLTKLFN